MRLPRFPEPDPSHTLEERVVHWYFSQLDSNNSSDINKREMKPFKRYLKKKAKPKKCTRRFTDYCDLNKDKSISLQELKGCLGVRKEEGWPVFYGLGWTNNRLWNSSWFALLSKLFCFGGIVAFFLGRGWVGGEGTAISREEKGQEAGNLNHLETGSTSLVKCRFPLK